MTDVLLVMLQQPKPPPAPSTIVQTMFDFFLDGGVMMWPILTCSVVVLGLALDRLLALRHGRLLPRVVLEAIAQVCSGRVDGAAQQVAVVDAPGARALAAALRRRGCTIAEVEKALEDQMAKEAMRLRGNVRGVSLMAAVAPLLGLLGTVVGISQAFGAVAHGGLGRNEIGESLAAGIKVAMYNTIFGLIVAIPATVIAAWLHARARSVIIHLGETLAPVIEHIAGSAGAPDKREAIDAA